MKSFLCSAALLLAAASPLPAENTPPAPVPTGAGAVAGSVPPAPAAGAPAADASAPLDPDTPEDLRQYGVDRYDKIVEKSPFNFKIIKQQAAPAISFAADLSLAGFTIDVGKGVTYASVVDKKKNTRSVINTQRPNKEGIQLVKLNRGDSLLTSTILARKGGEEHEIKAEKQIVERKSVVSAAVAPRGGQPGGAGQPGIAPNAPGQPGGPNLNPNFNRQNNVQAQINTQLQPPPPPGANQPQQGGANVTGGGVSAVAVQPGATAAPTVADQAMQRQGGGRRGEGRGGDGQQGDGQQPQPNKRRVILPPPVNAQ